MLELVAERPNADDIRVEIPLDALPTTVGRGSVAGVLIQKGWIPDEQWGQLSRVHATIDRDDDNNIFLVDGTAGKESTSGCYVNGKKIKDKQRLYNRVEIDISLPFNGYRVFIAWTSTTETYIQDFPTVEVERDHLRMENTRNEIRILDLEAQMATALQRIEQVENVNVTQDGTIKQQDNRIKAQGSLISKLKRVNNSNRKLMIAFVVFGIVSAWRFLGGDAKTLDNLIGAVSIGLSIWTGASVASPAPENTTE